MADFTHSHQLPFARQFFCDAQHSLSYDFEDASSQVFDLHDRGALRMCRQRRSSAPDGLNDRSARRSWGLACSFGRLFGLGFFGDSV